MKVTDLAIAAKLVYPSTCSRQETEIRLHRMFPWEPWGIRFIDVARTDSEGLVMRAGGIVLVAFAGTESWRDILLDLWFIPGAYYHGDIPMIVHSGFAGAVGAAGPRVVAAVHSLFRDDMPALATADVWATGHSLGAAVALGALDAIRYCFPEVLGRTRAITFGCPNGWSGAAREAWNRRHRGANYINPWDYVTKLLGITTGRPGRDIRLKGRAGHFMDKYIENLEGLHRGKAEHHPGAPGGPEQAGCSQGR
jgi:hypothetical protein